VRAGQYRFGVGWQLTGLFQPDAASVARCLPLRQMDCWGACLNLPSCCPSPSTACAASGSPSPRR
jgi:hypothetical protein